MNNLLTQGSWIIDSILKIISNLAHYIIELIILSANEFIHKLNTAVLLVNKFIAGAAKLLVAFNFTPSPNFLSDIAAFEAAVIALAIPLSFEIVSRISERYQSDVISKRFVRERVIVILPIFMVINIILAVSLRFCAGDTPSSTLWKIFAWVTFIMFIVIALIFIFSFIPRLKKYMTSSDFVTDGLFNDAEKAIRL